MRGIVIILLACWLAPAAAGFRTPQSLVQNVFAYYGKGDAPLSSGLPRDAATAQRFFERSLAELWAAPQPRPFDFIAQAASWRIGPVRIDRPFRQDDRLYVPAAFSSNGRPLTLNFVLVESADGWLISDIESPHDSLRRFLARLKE